MHAQLITLRQALLVIFWDTLACLACLVYCYAIWRYRE